MRPDPKQTLLNKLNNHTARIAVIGLGYVGLPLAVAFAEEGFPVVGIDVDGGKVEAINSSHSYTRNIPGEHLRSLR